MTRRLAIVIFFTVCTTLIIGGLVVYLATRQIMLGELDASLVARAEMIPEIAGPTRAAVSGAEDRYIVTGSGGRTLARPATHPASPPQLTVIKAAFVIADGQRMRSLTLSGHVLDAAGRSTPVRVVYSAPAVYFDRVLDRLLVVLVGFGLTTALAAVGAAVWISRAALRPLQATTRAVGEIDEHSLNRRINAEALPDELHPVATRLNQLLERLECAFSQRRQFLADASHELRTPVAALVTSLEIALNRPRGQAELVDALQTCLTEARLLKKLVISLMEQARSETPAGNEAPEPIQLAELLQECATVGQALGKTRDVNVTWDVPAELRLTTQPSRLRSVIMNLVSNAVEHTRAGGAVTLTAYHNGKGVELEIADQGPGIAAEHLPHIFEPFYRVNAARSTAFEHLGLGLFLVRSHLQALGGVCHVESRVGEGSTFSVIIPEQISQITKASTEN